MFDQLKEKCKLLLEQVDLIPTDRKLKLEQIVQFVVERLQNQQSIQLMYVCTHNSRRSHFGQIWAQVAADYFNVPLVQTFSGGTEATAFHSHAIQALREAGFEITAIENRDNPMYTVKFGVDKEVNCLSKLYDDSVNPTHDFAAIMTCSEAEENCPFIPGAILRVATTYDDPKAFDGTPLQAEKYNERSNQIALECVYVFARVQELYADFLCDVKIQTIPA